jgi:hypothetical protein
VLIQKTNPVGIDFVINQVQEFLHGRLLTQWQIGESAKYRCYPRCYRNKVDYGYIAENYEGGAEYKEVYWDDSFTVISFFGIGPSVRHNIKEETEVHLVFFVNLAKVKPAITHRADEEVHQDLLNLIGEGLFDFDYTGLDTGIDNVLREYPGSRRDKRLLAVDMHPVHCFRLNFKATYNINIC